MGDAGMSTVLYGVGSPVVVDVEEARRQGGADDCGRRSDRAG